MQIKWWQISLIVIASLALGFGYGKKCSNSGLNEQRDTIVIYETKTEIKPVSVSSTLDRWQALSVPELLLLSDTVTMETIRIQRDSIYIPIEQKYYERQEGRLRIWISGYQPSLDRYELDEKTMTVTERKHWGFSIGAGPAVIYSPFNKNIDGGIGLFAGITYTF